MALLFPILINGNRFLINPLKINVKKRSQISEVRTMAGTTFQIWPDMPDEVKFEGMAFGLNALFELQLLKKSIVLPIDSKEVTLTYKFNNYRGYIRDLEISVDAEKPRQFLYNFSFVSKDPFNIETMVIGQTTGLAEEFDYVTAQLQGAAGVLTHLPADAISGIANVANSIGRVGMNIGRLG